MLLLTFINLYTTTPSVTTQTTEIPLHEPVKTKIQPFDFNIFYFTIYLTITILKIFLALICAIVIAADSYKKYKDKK